jgi:hypothetical protein
MRKLIESTIVSLDGVGHRDPGPAHSYSSRGVELPSPTHKWSGGERDWSCPG